MTDHLFNLNGDISDGTYTLTREEAREAMMLVLNQYTPGEFLAKKHEAQVITCGAALAAAQGLGDTEGFVLYIEDRESLPFDVAHALAHMLADFYRAGVNYS